MLVAQLWNSSVSLITLLTYIELQPLLVLISVNNNWLLFQCPSLYFFSKSSSTEAPSNPVIDFLCMYAKQYGLS